MIAQLCKHNKQQWTGQLNWVKFMICELHINKAIIKMYYYNT